MLNVQRMPTNPKDFLSVTQAAELLRIGRHRVWVLIRLGKLEAAKIGNTFAVYRESVESRVRERKKASRKK